MTMSDAAVYMSRLRAAGAQYEVFGKGSIMKLGDDSHVPAAAISTGCLSLDIGLGIGGVPRGRVVEIFGPESSGKTTLVYHHRRGPEAEAGSRRSSTPSTRWTRRTPAASV